MRMEGRTSHFKGIAESFDIYGDFLNAERYGSGHINDTFLARFNQAGETVCYIFQRINTNVFRKPVELMENISRCLSHVQMKLEGLPDASRRCLTVVPLKGGNGFHTLPDGSCWRCYLYIERARTYDILDSPAQAYAAAKAFGIFQMQLSDLGGKRLHETIPDFHHTPKRLEAFDRVLASSPKDRRDAAAKEIEFVQSHRGLAPVLLNLLAKGELPERITHNDTKINNVMLDDESGEGICVIDLDTVMPGLSAYDFGDLVRTSVSPAAEDERDLSKITLRKDVFEALAKGFIDGYDGKMPKKEREMLPFGGVLITFEIGLRFLTDFLDGDKYFKIHRQNHNLDRCRTQFRLVELLESEMSSLREITERIP